MRFKMDLNNLQKFLKLRMAKDAQREIRLYANEIFNMMKKFFPTLSDNFEKQNLSLFYPTYFIAIIMKDKKIFKSRVVFKDNQYETLDGLNVFSDKLFVVKTDNEKDFDKECSDILL
jgi:thymidylate synthase ThyX